MPLLEYESGKTIFHKMSPSMKVVWGVLIMAWLFVMFNPFYVLTMGVVIFVVAKFSAGLSVKRMIRTTMFVGVGSIFIVVFQALLYPGETVLFRLGPLHPTWEGVKVGLAIGFRLLSVVAMSTIIAKTTDPRDVYLTLINLGLPYRVSHMLFTALRFIPLMEYETETIREAQKVRGIAREGGMSWINQMKNLLLSLIAAGIRRADQSAIAADVRAFGLRTERTYLREMNFSKSGWLFVGCWLVLFAGYMVITGGNLSGIWDTNPLRDVNLK